MNDMQDKTISLNVRLNPIEHSDRPHTANYTNVGVAQGIAYLDFGFLEPVLLGAIARTATNGQPAPKELHGTLVTRVAMPLDSLVRLHQQVQQVLIGMRDARQPGVKDSK
jgi:hypothetical protein